MATNLIQATVNFTDKEITIAALMDLAANKILLKIVDPLGNLVYQNAYWDASLDTDFDLQYSTSKSITKNMPLDSSDVIIQGQYYIYWKVAGSKVLHTLWFKYCPTLPVIDVDLEYSCRTSTITSTDATNYDLVNSCSTGSVTVEASRTLYGHTLYYPTTMEEQQDPVTSDTPAEAIIVTPIWTKRWVAQIETVVSYEMPLPAMSGQLGYFIEGTLNGQRYVDVACSDCICTLVTCINQIYNEYKRVVEKDSVRARELQVQLDMLYLLFFRFLFAEKCGQEADVTTICNEIKAYMNYTGLACCGEEPTTQYSVEVVPYGAVTPSQTTVLGGTNWYNGTTDPSSATGLDGDFYLQTTSKTIWKKISGVWTLIMTITFTGTVGNYLMVSDTDAASSYLDVFTELKSFDFDTNDVADGSVLQVSSTIRFDEPSYDDIYIRFSFAGATTKNIDILVDSEYNGSQFPLTFEVEYLIKDNSPLTMVSSVVKVFGKTGVVYYDYNQTSVVLSTSPVVNTVGLSVQSKDGITFVRVDNFRINHLRTV